MNGFKWYVCQMAIGLLTGRYRYKVASWLLRKRRDLTRDQRDTLWRILQNSGYTACTVCLHSVRKDDVVHPRCEQHVYSR